MPVRFGLTPMLTPTLVNVGELPRTLDRQNGPFSAPSCTSVNVPERRTAGSKTAGCKFDSCPTCPANSEFMGAELIWNAAYFACFDPTWPQREQRRSRRSKIQLVINFPVQQGPAAFGQSLAT